MRLNELNFKDTYPKQFHEFVREYRKHKNNSRYYVQFSNHATDIVDKRMYDSPDHSDPMGVYGYPIKYVIEHPSDIWYGRNAMYLRVLKVSTHKILDLQSMTLSDMDNIIYRMKLGRYLSSSKMSVEVHLKKIIKKFRYTGSKAFHKAFMSFVQCKLDEDGMPLDSMISAREQNVRFRLAGYDAIIDNARTVNSAIINNREPTQIIFLARDSFEVETVYTLRNKEPASIITGKNDDTALYKKIAGLFFKSINDPLVDSMGKGRFWSKGGIEMQLTYDEKLEIRMELMFGTGFNKPHKQYKKHDDAVFGANIITKYGNIEAIQDSEQTIGSFVQDLVNEYKKLVDIGNVVDGWQPSTKQAVEDNIKKDEDERIRRNIEIKVDKYKRDYTEYRQCMSDIAKGLGLEFSVPVIDEIDEKQLHILMGIIGTRRTVKLIRSLLSKISVMDTATKNIASEFIDTAIEISKSGLKFANSLYNPVNDTFHIAMITVIDLDDYASNN